LISEISCEPSRSENYYFHPRIIGCSLALPGAKPQMKMRHDGPRTSTASRGGF
jgi:hypothetical protein